MFASISQHGMNVVFWEFGSEPNTCNPPISTVIALVSRPSNTLAIICVGMVRMDWAMSINSLYSINRETVAGYAIIHRIGS